MLIPCSGRIEQSANWENGACPIRADESGGCATCHPCAESVKGSALSVWDHALVAWTPLSVGRYFTSSAARPSTARWSTFKALLATKSAMATIWMRVPPRIYARALVPKCAFCMRSWRCAPPAAPRHARDQFWPQFNLVLVSLLVVSLSSSSSLRGDAQTLVRGRGDSCGVLLRRSRWYIISAASALTTTTFALWKQIVNAEFPGAALIPVQLFAVMPIIVGWQTRIAGDTTSSPLHNALFGIALVLLAFVFLLLEKTSELALGAQQGKPRSKGMDVQYNAIF